MEAYITKEKISTLKEIFTMAFIFGYEFEDINTQTEQFIKLLHQFLQGTELHSPAQCSPGYILSLVPISLYLALFLHMPF